MKNWRVRSRLLLLITIPTLAALALGGSSIVTSVQNALAYQRVEQLANLSSTVTLLAAHLESERDATLLYLGQGIAGRTGTMSSSSAERAAAEPDLFVVQQSQDQTNPWVRDLRRQITTIGAGYPAQVEDDAHEITALLNFVQPLRAAATTTALPAIDVQQKYTSMIDELLGIDNNIALSSGDPALTSDVRALNLISLIAEEASEQRGLLDYAFAQDGIFNAQVLDGVTTALADMNANVAEYDRVATSQQVTLYNDVFAKNSGLVDFASEYEQQAIQYGESGTPLHYSATTADNWNGAMTTGTIGAIETVQQDLVADTIARASALRNGAILDAAVTGAIVLIVLLVALLLTTAIGRSMVRPLRRLRSGALEVAGIRLPEMVRRMSDSDAGPIPLEVEPIDVDSTDEIGEVARAFDQVHREAVRLAANEAALRGNVNAMFVNLSRRSQSLVERQIRLIDDLEQGEQDSDRLASLFQMDHLATRMRRNSENLLVLAGHEATRRWNRPVALVDVLRAAVSEIEQYERVSLNVQPGIAVRGHAVNDVVHLLAELAENATSFSSAETPVVVAGHLLSSGGVLLDITDQGVGMGAEEMAHANWRLDNPPVVDVAVSRRMGLFVVARLAARHGIRVRLRPAAAGGLTALVWLPDEVISHEVDAGLPGLRRFDTGEMPAVGSPVGLATAGLPAGANGFSDDSASTAEREIAAARAPKFASLRADSAEPAEDSEAAEGAQAAETVSPDSGGLGPRRVPGAGPHPGTAPWATGTTAPVHAFRSSPQTAATAQDDEVGEVFSTGPVPAAESASPAVAEFTALPEPAVLGAPAGTAHIEQAEPSAFSWDGGAAASASGVVVPPVEHVATENRLPIFEAVESDWFRRGRSGLGGWPAQAEAASAGLPEVAWATPSDQGWEAAAAASSPATGGTTSAGLPKRVPQANLVPGTAASEQAVPPPVRSAAATRERFTSFQRGSREGRAAATTDEDSGSGDDGAR